MTIKQMLDEYISDMPSWARLEVRNGIEGVKWTGPDATSDEWLPLDRIGYNNDMGFFDKTVFPNQYSVE